MKEFLVSPGYGAGWSSWADDEYKRFVLFYQPYIDILKRGGKITQEDEDKFYEDFYEEFGDDAYFHHCDADQLQVFVCDDEEKFRIVEYEGSEAVDYKEHIAWF